MKGPSVSVLIPVFNRAALLERALQSVRDQGYSPLQVIVIDDGSTDESAVVASRHPDVVCLRQSNLGPAAARNLGLRHADGELVAFLDSDDRWPPTKLSTQVEMLMARPELACVLGRQRIDFVGVDPPRWMRRDPVFGDLDGVPFGTAVIRSVVLRSLGGFDPSFRVGEDRDLLMRMRAAGHEIAVTPEVVLLRRYDGDNLSNEPTPAQHPLLRSIKNNLDRQRQGSVNG